MATKRAETFLEYWNRRLAGAGARLVTWSPGDGRTRYRLVRFQRPDDRADYFGGKNLVTVLGRSAAETMVRAYLEGWEAAARTGGEK